MTIQPSRVLGLAVLAFLQIAGAAAETFDPAGAAPAGSAPALLNDWLSFYAGFDREMAVADLAAGVPEPTSVRGTVRLEAGIIGRALRVGSGGAEVRFASSGNLEMAKPGALSLWVMPRSWRNSAPSYVQFVRVLGAGTAAFVLERDVRPAGAARDAIIAGLAGLPTGGKTLLFHPLPGMWRDGEWHLLAVDWDATGFGLSVDGAPFARRAVPGGALPRAFGATGSARGFVVGDGRSDSSLVDEVSAYDRPLTDDEIARLYAAPRRAAR